jgi:hypothetical protein
MVIEGLQRVHPGPSHRKHDPAGRIVPQRR